jgi:SAM-dependent MidA family methyltransferase
VTSPHVGSLFGALVGRALDREWDALGCPDPFVVIEAGAGDGRLARDVWRSAPRCLRALRYVLVERSPALRAEQAAYLPLVDAAQCFGPYAPAADSDADDPLEPVEGTGPLFAQLETMPARKVDGVVLANELLDNLPFAIAELGADGWMEIRVALASAAPPSVLGAYGRDTPRHTHREPDRARLVEFAVPLAETVFEPFDVDVPVGARVPLPRALHGWFAEAGAALRPGRGVVLLVDYFVPFAEVVARSPHWLRTYRAHAIAGSPLDEPGATDITADVPLEAAVRAANGAGLRVASVERQADWLRDLGIDELVAEGDAIWEARASVGDLAALAARSRGNEAAALTDPTGLGAFNVLRLMR